MNSWHTAWNRTMEIAVGAPQVISHRVGMMLHPAAWSPTTAAELQQMVAEKVQAATESWAVLCQAALSHSSDHHQHGLVGRRLSGKCGRPCRLGDEPGLVACQPLRQRQCGPFEQDLSR